MTTTKKNLKAVRGRGRPRGFDRRAALATALPIFWERGYEGTSIAELVHAMQINPPALYGAFGSKDALYREVLEFYIAEKAGFDPTLFFGESTAYMVVARMLGEAAAAFTSAKHPRGCMVSTAILNCAPEHRAVAEHVASLRSGMRQALEDRLRRACEDGDLPIDTDTAKLAIFYASIIQGMSVQAQDGADRAALTLVAEAALSLLPQPERQKETKQSLKKRQGLGPI